MIMSFVIISFKKHVSDITSLVTGRDYRHHTTQKLYLGDTEHYEQIAYTRNFNM